MYIYIYIFTHSHTYVCVCVYYNPQACYTSQQEDKARGLFGSLNRDLRLMPSFPCTLLGIILKCQQAYKSLVHSRNFNFSLIVPYSVRSFYHVP